MVDTPTPPTPDDDLLARLRTLGPVLDELTAEASADGAEGVPAALAGTGRDSGPGSGSGLRNRRRGRQAGNRRRRGLAIAAAVLVVAGVAGVLIAGNRDQQTITTDQTTTTSAPAPDPALTALVADRLTNLEECGSVDEIYPTPWPDGWQLVMGPDCDAGWVEEGAEAVQPVPVHRAAEPGPTIAWWSPSTGWIGVREYEDPAFDLGAYRAAYAAAVEAGGATTTTSS